MGRAYFDRLQAQRFISRNRGTAPEVWKRQKTWARAYIESPMGRIDWQRQKAMGFLTPAFIAEIETWPLSTEIGLD